jgi:hypothetical protein
VKRRISTAAPAGRIEPRCYHRPIGMDSSLERCLLASGPQRVGARSVSAEATPIRAVGV